MAKKRTTGDILREYGFDTSGPDGALIRTKLGAMREQFVPVDGGWEFYVMVNGEWQRKVHHVDTDDSGPTRVMTPNYTWPDDEVAHIYGEAIKAREA